VVFEMVTRPEGASLGELIEASGLRETSIKAMISIYCRGRAGYDRNARRYLPVR
jgi:hypothetical protein